MATNEPEGWKAVVDRVISEPGLTVVVGDVDVGKSTFCALLANRGLEAGIPTAVVDADMGQSEIGPPTTIGLGLMETPIQSLGDISAESLFFVGSTSPVGHMLAVATGAKKLAEEAASLGMNLIIVDTTGLVRGAVARRLKTHKLELLKPRHIVAIQRAVEAEHFLRFFDTWDACTVHRLGPSPDARAKSPILRAQRRAVRFQEYFRDSQAHDLDLGEIATAGTWLRTGEPMEPKYRKFAERVLRATVHHGEVQDKGVMLVVSGTASGRGITELQEFYNTRSVVVIPASVYQNLLVGLTDSRLEVLALGIVRGIDFKSQIVSALTPLRSVSPVRSMRFGVLKVRPDGTEIGQVRPSEI